MRLRTALLVGLTCGVLAGCSDHDAHPSVEAKRVSVERAVVSGYRPKVEITGEIKARVQSDLAFRTGGRVTERLADVGAQVHAGDVLARVDDTVQRADVDIARAKLAAAEAALEQKQLVFDRYQALLKSRTIAQSTFDQSHEDLVTAQGSVETAKASLATAEDALSYTQLKADADGVITARSIELGQVVSAAQTAMTLAHDGPRDAVFNLPEAFFLHGAPEPAVGVASIDRSQNIAAVTREVSPAIDTNTGTIRVKVTLPDSVNWPLGTPVIGTFQSPSRDGIILPWSAMASAGGAPAVWVVDPEQKAVSLHKVALLRHEAGKFVVTAGIAPRDLVVTQGTQFLMQGQIVTWEGQ